MATLTRETAPDRNDAGSLTALVILYTPKLILNATQPFEQIKRKVDADDRAHKTGHCGGGKPNTNPSWSQTLTKVHFQSVMTPVGKTEKMALVGTIKKTSTQAEEFTFIQLRTSPLKRVVRQTWQTYERRQVCLFSG